MLRRTLLGGLPALMLSAALLPHTAMAQTAAPSVDAPVTISFYNYNLASAGLGGEATRKLIAEFMEANPNIIVEGVAVGSQDMASRLQADMAANRIPDVAQVVFDSLAFVADNLGAVALEDAIPADELAAHFEGMIPAGLNLGRLDDKTYALAYTFSTPVLFYNADLFVEAGLDPDNPPRNWQEVRDAAAAIAETTGAGGFNGSLAGGGAAGFDWALQGVLLSNGGGVLSDDRATLTFDDPATIEAVQMLRDLHEAGIYENMPSEVMIEQMNSGRMGMLLTTSAQQNTLIRAAEGQYDLRVAAMPGFGDRAAVPTNSGSGLVILSEDPVKQRAAFELMKFLTSERGYTIITSEIGYLPLRPSIVDDPAYLADWVEANPLVRPNLAQLERMQPWAAYPGQSYRQIARIFLDAVELAVFGGADVEQTLTAAQSQAQSLMPR
ncbi:MAG: ABC transporter substrate-binding protein [Paracoccaceae bacterium]